MAVDREEALGLLQRDHAHNEDLTSSDKGASNDVANSCSKSETVKRYLFFRGWECLTTVCSVKLVTTYLPLTQIQARSKNSFPDSVSRIC